MLNDYASMLDRVIRDLSTTDARLVFQNFQPVPERFRLVVKELGTYDFEIVRIQDTEYGMRLTSKG